MYLPFKPAFSVNPVALSTPPIVSIALYCDRVVSIVPAVYKAYMGYTAQIGEPKAEDVARLGLPGCL